MIILNGKGEARETTSFNLYNFFVLWIENVKLTSRRVEFSETASFICHLERIALHLRIEFRAVFRFSVMIMENITIDCNSCNIDKQNKI